MSVVEINETAGSCDSSCVEQASEAELMCRLDAIIKEYCTKDGGLIPVLQIAQTIFGYLPDVVVSRIADGFGKSVSEVAGVISFYSFFTRQPRGKYLVRVCLGTACYVRGGKEVLDAFKKKLEIDVGETTPDRRFSLDVGRCFGACGMAPVVMINDDTYQRVKPTRIGELLAQFTTEEESVEQEEG